MSEQPQIQDQSESQSNLPAVVGTLLDNLKAVIADQMPDDDAYVLATEMVTIVQDKFIQVMEDGRLMVASALEQRDEAISLKEIAEQKAREITEALDDWMDTDNPKVRELVQDIEEGVQEYLYDGYMEMVAGDEFSETFTDAMSILTGISWNQTWPIASLFLEVASERCIPKGTSITPIMVDAIEALWRKMKQLSELGPLTEDIDEDDDEF